MTAKRWWKRFKETGNIKMLPVPGCSRKTTAADDIQIIETFEGEPFSTAVSVARVWPVGRHTIGKRLADVGIRNRIAARHTEMCRR